MAFFNLGNHMKSVHSNSLVPCVECVKVFRNAMLLKGHINKVHNKIPCSICKDMVSKGKLSFHMHQKHTPISERKHKCEICGKGFCDKSRLKDHINVHTGEKPHKCKFCDKSFGALQLLKGHVNQSHTREICPHCQKSILNTFFLKKHLVFDHGIKDGALFCDFCPKKVFFFEGYLKKHMKEKHGSPG